MNPLLQILGLLIVFVPSILTIAVLLVVLRASRRVQDELHALRTELARRESEQQPNP